MIYTLSDLRAGRVAILNDGTLQQLTDVMGRIVFGFSNFYWFCGDKICCSNDTPDLPTQSVSLFSLREEPQERVFEDWLSEMFDVRYYGKPGTNFDVNMNGPYTFQELKTIFLNNSSKK